MMGINTGYEKLTDYNAAIDEGDSGQVVKFGKRVIAKIGFAGEGIAALAVVIYTIFHLASALGINRESSLQNLSNLKQNFKSCK